MRYSPDFLDELRRRVGLAELIGRRIKLERRGREYAGLCPFHNERTPSFFVVEEEGFFHCFGCGAHGDAIRFVMQADNVDFRTAVIKLAAAAVAGPLPSGRAIRPANHQAAVELSENEQRRRRSAWRLWDLAVNPCGTLVETYLHGRGGLSLPSAPVLRFALRCWNHETGRLLPAMLARVDDASGKFMAVHRTWLTLDGRKAALRYPKMSLGPTRGGAIRLAPPGPVLAIAEGMENALTAIAVGYAAWSAVSAGGMQTLELPPIVENVLVIIDHDPNGVGQAAARRAGARWRAEGRKVASVMPPMPGDDLNDLLLAP